MDPDTDTPNLANLAKEWDSLHNSVPAVLYHYTTAAGLTGILGSQRLWATNARFLNDPSEIRYALNVVSDTVNESEKAYLEARNAEANLTTPDLVSPIWGLPVPKIESWAKDLLEVFNQQREAYVTSFCEEGDLLSQWRGYAAAGGGYAIGIAADDIGRPAKARSGPPVILRKVIYDPETQRRIVSRWVQAMFDLDLTWRRARRDDISEGQKQAVARLGSSGSSPIFGMIAMVGRLIAVLPSAQAKSANRIEEIQTRMTQFLAECLISFKDPAYFEEREWRAIQFGLDAPLVKFRTQEGNVVPFVELDLTSADGSGRGQLPVRRITYGPTLEPGMTDRALKILCEAFGYSDPEVTVSQSGIPYRGSR